MREFLYLYTRLGLPARQVMQKGLHEVWAVNLASGSMQERLHNFTKPDGACFLFVALADTSLAS